MSLSISLGDLLGIGLALVGIYLAIWDLKVDLKDLEQDSKKDGE